MPTRLPATKTEHGSQLWSRPRPHRLRSHYEGAIVGAMPARTTRESTPDLFAPTESRASSTQLPASPKIGQAVGVPAVPQLLPNDLSGALRHLDDAGIDRLLAAVVDEAKRRGRLPPGGSIAARDDRALGGRQRASAGSRPKPTAGAADGPPALTQGRINAVRAAFKAGVKPSAIARQFGLSLSAVRLALDPATRGAKS